MQAKTQGLLDQIEDSHDWAEGQMRSGGGTQLTSTSICRICSLRRHSLYDPQNGITDTEYRFSDGETNADLSLRQAITRGCL